MLKPKEKLLDTIPCVSTNLAFLYFTGTEEDCAALDYQYESRRRAIEKQILENDAVEYHSKDLLRHCIVTPSTRTDGGYQLTFITSHGDPVYHETRSSVELIADCVPDNFYAGIGIAFE